VPLQTLSSSIEKKDGGGGGRARWRQPLTPAKKKEGGERRGKKSLLRKSPLPCKNKRKKRGKRESGMTSWSKGRKRHGKVSLSEEEKDDYEFVKGGGGAKH